MRIAVIPARGGSKRLPGKNVRMLGGRPLVAWSICAARASGLFESVLVSTDDEEIAAVAKQYQAEVIERPENLAGDNIATHEAILHAYLALGGMRRNVDCVATLQPTNPFRSVKLLIRAINEYEANECDSLLTVSKRRLKCGNIEGGYYYPDYEFGQQSRLTAPVIFENGLLYVTSQKTLLEGNLCGGRVLPLVTDPPFDEVDIDVEEDFIRAESLVPYANTVLGY
jgi:N-acylneuraminate cytidylyltransferase